MDTVAYRQLSWFFSWVTNIVEENKAVIQEHVVPRRTMDDLSINV